MTRRVAWTRWILPAAALLLGTVPSCTGAPNDSDGTGGQTEAGGTGGDDESGGTGGHTTGGTGGGTGGELVTGGTGACTSESAPSGARCADDAVRYRFTWWDVPCGLESEFPPVEQVHECALGCREDGETSWDDETMFLMCEEGSVRAPGFPCSFDIDCRAPVGATEGSNLGLGGAGGLGGGAGQGGEPADEALLHCVSGVCQVGAAAAVPADLGDACITDARSGDYGARVGHADSCETGGCLVAGPEETEGLCTSGCAGSPTCPTGYTCAPVADDRYTAWGSNYYDVPLELEVCVPEP